jgi:trans-2,3-dihydro-3-hydroxyanthranilate isomerase
LDRSDHPCYVVDVFAERKFGGNQLAVVRNCLSFSDEEMQKLAREFNFSETTFILSDEKENGGYNVRIFTPKEELPFAGHPTLGTAFIIQKEILRQPVERISLNLKVGQIPVKFTYREDGQPDLLWMQQLEPKFKEIKVPRKGIAEMLSLEEMNLDPSFPVQEVSTGLPTTIVPLKSLDGVKRAKTNREKYFQLVDSDSVSKNILVFAREAYSEKNDLNVRVFCEYFGITEDPATGSGNGALAAYLVKNKYFGKPRIENLRVEQGYEIGRQSLLFLTSAEDGKTGKISVYVGGRVQSVVKGELVG